MLDLPALFSRLLLGGGTLVLPLAGDAGAIREPAPGAVAPDKSVYTLFNPTPPDLMRELSPDRPDKTESPYTVDAGHFQLEMDFANFTATDTEGARIRAWNVAPINFKIGLLNQVDLQFVFDNYLHVRRHDPGATARDDDAVRRSAISRRG